MKMFVDMNMRFGANIDSTSSSFSSGSSINSNFSPDGSDWDSSSTVDTPVHTPTRSNFDVKLEDLSMRTSTPSCTPERRGPTMAFCNMNSITPTILSGFSDSSMIFSPDGKLLSDQTMMGYNNFSTYVGPTSNSFGNSSCLSLDSQSFDGDLFSPMPDLGNSPTEDYVNPTQTTFMDTFDYNSPLQSAKATNFKISYDTPASDYDVEFEQFLPYHDLKSCSVTPSRYSSLRHAVLEPLQTAGALQRGQEQSTPIKQEEKQSLAAKKALKVRKRALRDQHLPNGVQRVKQPTEQCQWEGCTKKFARREHLKRHADTHLGQANHPCEFCHKGFSRQDNLKSHVWLHFQPPKKSSRTLYFARAQQVYENMGRKTAVAKSEKLKREDDKGLLTRSRGQISGF